MSSDRHELEMPTPYEDWTIVANAFDQGRDPNMFDDFGTSYQSGHGRLLVELDVAVDSDDHPHGLIQFVHEGFATDITSPRLAALLNEVVDTVRERQREPVYLEVEHYEDGHTVFGVIFDAEGLDELDRRLKSAEGPAESSEHSGE